jgi:hypothetical protein
LNLCCACGALCFGTTTSKTDGSLSAVDAAIMNCVSEIDYLAERNARPIALSISLAYDEAMKLAWLDLVLLTLVFAVLIYVFFT